MSPDRYASGRIKREARSVESMPVCACGARAHVRANGDWRNRIDLALGQVSRTRECPACGAAWRTLELRESEVQELRRLAHLWQMHGHRAPAAD